MELEAKQVPADYTVILNEQNRRDREDEARPVGQLRKADDAIEIVTDDLTLDQVVAKIVEIVLHRKKSLEAN
jgi:pantoate ligase/cytidylate kinase